MLVVNYLIANKDPASGLIQCRNRLPQDSYARIIRPIVKDMSEYVSRSTWNNEPLDLSHHTSAFGDLVVDTTSPLTGCGVKKSCWRTSSAG